MARGVDVLVATPGRLLDLVNQRAARLDHVRILVLDEADQMLDRGFLPDVRRIVRQVPQERQTLFFSATMPEEIAKLSAEMLKDPARIAVAPVATTAERIAQRAIHLPPEQKRRVLAELLRAPGVGRALVFSRTKHGADRIVKHLEADGIRANAIHGNRSQGQRERALDEFKRGTAPILVATDIAARGIDVEGVTHVIQFDLPEVPETYVHRIGRTARAGASGEAVALVAPEDAPKLRAVEKLIRMKVPAEAVAGGAMPAEIGSAARAPQRPARPPRRDGARPAAAKPAGKTAPAPRAERPATIEGRKDRSWREADFRDSPPLPGMERRRRG
jgi:ATP-dependent RNA helicase RhlE